MTSTYYLLPEPTGKFTLFNTITGYEKAGLTIKFAKSYCAFQGAELVVLAADGTPRYSVL